MRDLTVSQAAEILGFQIRWVRELLATGRLHGRRNGRAWLIPEEEIQRYRSGKSGGRAIALKQDQEVEIPENLLTTLMSEQARESMSRHSKDLHSEAGRWLEKVRAFHEGDLGFDYLLANLDFVESQSEDWLTTIFFHSHLKEDQPTTFEKFGQWFKEARAFKEIRGAQLDLEEI